MAGTEAVVEYQMQKQTETQTEPQTGTQTETEAELEGTGAEAENDAQVGLGEEAVVVDARACVRPSSPCQLNSAPPLSLGVREQVFDRSENQDALLALLAFPALLALLAFLALLALLAQLECWSSLASPFSSHWRQTMGEHWRGHEKQRRAASQWSRSDARSRTLCAKDSRSCRAARG